jgi:ubiquinol-cytochrome c reductase cytochrome b subunit
VRTGLGALGIAVIAILTFGGGEDILATTFSISLNAILWTFRIGVLVVPPIAYYVTYRICLGLQRGDRAVLEHGVETGLIRRLPHGEFVEVHQPLGPTDEHGHPVPLDYQGAPVPKRMNKIGASGAPVSGGFLSPDSPEETAALERARTEDADGDHDSESGQAELTGRSHTED